MNILDLHQKFRRYCAVEERLSPSTIKDLKNSVSVLVKRSGARNLEDINLDVLRTFFYDGMEIYQWAYWTYANYHKYLKKFLGWCVIEGYLERNFVVDIKKPAPPKRLPRRLTYEEAQKVLQETFYYGWRYEHERCRNYAIMATFMYTGLRCGELAKLRIIDVDLNNLNILVRSGKGNKDRNVPIHHKLKYILKSYFNDRERLGKKSEFLFTGLCGDLPLSYKAISKVCKKISVASKVKFTPHCLRHTFGSVAVEQGMNVVCLKEIMGHSDISSTMIYLSMSSKGLQESLERIELF